MKTKFKFKFFLSLLLPILAIFVMASAFFATAETPEPTVSIEKFNLTFASNIYIKYAVKLSGVENPTSQNFGMLFWTEPQTAYEKGTEALASPTLGVQNIGGEDYYIFSYEELAAKQMTDNIYARAYVEANGNIYYSNVEKYSILQYAYNKLGATGTATDNENLKNGLRKMLEYGAAMQVYFDYATDRLATADFYQVQVEGGTLSDGLNHGLFLAGERAILTAPEQDANGIPFAYWKDSAGNNVGTESTQTVTVGNANKTYTAVYQVAATPNEYFTFTLLKNGTYEIAAKSKSQLPSDVVIPASYQGIPVTSIGNFAFYNCTGLMSITIPDSVTSIGNDAFKYCGSLTSVTIGNSVTSIGDWAFSYCSSLTSVTIGNSVTSIGEYAFDDCSSLTSVTIGNSVTSIGYGAFEYCSSLTSVTIGNSVTSIGDSAFKNCISLTSITIPDSVTSIGNYAFSGCQSLTSITIPDSVTSIGDSAFSNCSSLTSVTIPNSVTRIGSYAFSNCSSLTSVTIPDSVTSIGYSAFKNCISLTSITIPDSVTSIGDWAFEYCSSLTSITIPDSVTSIGYGAFEYCSSLTNITIPDSVTSIEDWAFEYCSSLTSITIPDSVTSIGNEAFRGCSELTSVTIGNSVTSIGSYAFYFCSSLTSITIPDSVTSIGDDAFRSCSNLTSVTIGNSVTSIGSYAFYDCRSLTSITIPDSVTSIGDHAFSACSLTNITIPDSVTSIGDWAFEGCYKLVEVYNLSSLNITKGSTENGSVGYYALAVHTSADEARKVFTDENGYIFYEDGNTCYLVGYTGKDTALTLPENCHGKNYGIYQHAFYDCRSLTSITIPDSVTSIGDWAFYGCYKLVEVYNLSSLNITKGSTENGRVGYYALAVHTSADEASKLFTDENGYIFYEDGNTCYLVGYTGKDTALTLPANCHGKNYGIYHHAFYNCSSLTSVTIPDSVTSIGNYAFYGCDNLKSVTIGNSVTSIGYYAFSVCSSLTSVTIGNSVTSIGDVAFYGCSRLTSVTIPNSVTSIGYSAFSGCSRLTSVTIGNSVTSIGEYAFSGCSSLTSVYYTGTAAEWDAISVSSSGNSYLTGATRYYYSESAPSDTTLRYWHYVDGTPTPW